MNGCFESPIGMIYYSINDGFVTALSFEKLGNTVEGNSDLNFNTEAKLKQEISEYFEGKLKTFTVPVNLIGTAFQKLIWNEIIKIPYGQTITYAQISINIKNKNASRAVGNATGKNPVLILIPCHRIIGFSGELTGYAGGLERKAFLLNQEALFSGKTLF
jgi:O-6-methylguanine DNA methyltransferase